MKKMHSANQRTASRLTSLFISAALICSLAAPVRTAFALEEPGSGESSVSISGSSSSDSDESSVSESEESSESQSSSESTAGDSSVPASSEAPSSSSSESASQPEEPAEPDYENMDVEALHSALSKLEQEQADEIIAGLSEEKQEQYFAYLEKLAAGQELMTAYESLMSAETAEEYEALTEELGEEMLAALDTWMNDAQREALQAHLDSLHSSEITYEELFDAVLACKTRAEYDALMDGLSLEYLEGFRSWLADNEKETELEEYVASLPEASSGSSGASLGEVIYDSSVVSFTNVAPFGPAVTGKTVSPFRMVMRTMALSDEEEAEDEPVDFVDNEGIVTSKKVTYDDENNSYTVTLESYVTGETTTSSVLIPTDVVLVLDQSGSMANKMGKLAYGLVSGQAEKVYEKYSNNLYVNIGTADEPVWSKVTVEWTVTDTASQFKAYYHNLNGYVYNYTNETYFDYSNNTGDLYYQVGTEYYKVTVNREWHQGSGFLDPSYYTYSYSYTTDSTGTHTIDIGNDKFGYSRPDNSIIFYIKEDVDTYQYKFSYVNAEGNTQTESFDPDQNITSNKYYYQFAEEGDPRLEVLTKAMENLVAEIEKAAKGKDGQFGGGDDVNHRVAIVGFGSKSGYGNNTEILSVSGRNSNVTDGTVTQIGVQYDSNGGNSYTNATKKAFQSMNTETGVTMIDNAIKALAANGATRADLGMQMASDILNANPVAATEQRNRIVIMFTDGSPTDSNGFQLNIANNTIDIAQDIKDSGVTVYTVGIFDGADAGSAGAKPSGNLNNLTDSSTDAQRKTFYDACNWYMQRVSSNNGSVRNPSYYLSAATATELYKIFQQISDQIQNGSASVDLGTSTVVKDIVSPYFTLPAGTTKEKITVQTSDYTSGGNWSDPEDFENADIQVDTTNNTVSVSNFDFSKNYVDNSQGRDENDPTETGDFYGRKLIISFTIEPKAGFLGGNNVPTNGDASGIYNGDNKLMENFVRPVTNVAIADITVTAKDKNVYLGGGVTQAQMYENAVIKCGGVALDPTAANYGLKDWQNDFVDINITPSDAAANLTSDSTFNISASVEPKTAYDSNVSGPEASKKSASATANIRVFKPEMTFKDTEVNLGDTVPSDFTAANKDGATSWKHTVQSVDAEGKPVTIITDSTDTGVVMLDTAPDLALTYTSTPAAGSTITSADDIPVTVTVKIGEKDVTSFTTFLHTACDVVDDCVFNAEKEQFRLHIKSLSLTVDKTITGSMGIRDKNFTFTVSMTKGGEKVSFAAPAEDASYTVTNGDATFTLTNGQSVTLSGIPVNATVTITEANEDYEVSATKSVAQGTPTDVTVTTSTSSASVTETLSNNTTIHFTNTKEGTPDTGVLLDSLPYVLILAAVGAGVVIFLFRRRRTHDDD